MKRIIAPSFLASNFLQLASEVAMVNESAAEWLHLDIMDGRFVPNISFGLPVVEHIASATKKFCDVHLMIVEPEKYITDFKKAGADQLCVHIEACPHLHRVLEQIHDQDMKAGIAVNPHTPIDFLKDIIQHADVVNLMSVNPGFGGQAFIEHTYTKIKELRKMIDDKGLDTLIQIDGGVTQQNARTLFDTGANVLVAGSSVFKAADPKRAIADLLDA
ncbi:ribulose-phosphate 3-epimerase [Arachidicoccus ginsenosidivorans]|jgi:ribulose-phosphate 3-epimerase|uniref:Ribulose-phosphate 3-epimerase n=1 Tax=Arachidicoccus ginsenosidivorans TaxID=496057 RepID=A0A5B8VKB5_9BACT|nr:ribulose-phosphate 3-epimerase [Arachidicoccus ginsenosidivorans]QEC70718.1 ribulose-phosphate 3-epimerase [Arachidicoccus ginsenosidivorans]